MSSDSEDGDTVGAMAERLSSSFQIRSSDPEISRRKYKYAEKVRCEDGLKFNPSDYTMGQRSRNFQQFLDTCAPSKTKRSEGIGWISVMSLSAEDEDVDREKLCASWEKLQKSKGKIDFDAVAKLAKTNSYLPGIWLLYFDTGAPVDTSWEKIARATVEDKLGTHAKVTPFQDEREGKDLHGTQHCISVYTKDFTDKDDVLAVEAALRSLGFKAQMPYKPRVFSVLGIYPQNQWRLRPSIYTSRWDATKQAGSIMDFTKSPYNVMINYK